jgi:hypothetical protein
LLFFVASSTAAFCSGLRLGFYGLVLRVGLGF